MPLYLENTITSLWNVESGKELYTWEGNLDSSGGIAFESNGKKVVFRRESRISGTDRTESSLYFLDTETGEELQLEGYRYYNFSPDGKNIIVHVVNVRYENVPSEGIIRVIHDGGEIAIWDIEAGKELHKLDRPYNRAYYAQGGKKIITITDTDTTILDAETLEE